MKKREEVQTQVKKGTIVKGMPSAAGLHGTSDKPSVISTVLPRPEQVESSLSGRLPQVSVIPPLQQLATECSEEEIARLRKELEEIRQTSRTREQRLIKENALLKQQLRGLQETVIRRKSLASQTGIGDGHEQPEASLVEQPPLVAPPKTLKTEQEESFVLLTEKLKKREKSIQDNEQKIEGLQQTAKQLGQDLVDRNQALKAAEEQKLKLQQSYEALEKEIMQLKDKGLQEQKMIEQLTEEKRGLTGQSQKLQMELEGSRRQIETKQVTIEQIAKEKKDLESTIIKTQQELKRTKEDLQRVQESLRETEESRDREIQEKLGIIENNTAVVDALREDMVAFEGKFKEVSSENLRLRQLAIQSPERPAIYSRISSQASGSGMPGSLAGSFAAAAAEEEADAGLGRTQAYK